MRRAPFRPNGISGRPPIEIGGGLSRRAIITSAGVLAVGGVAAAALTWPIDEGRADAARPGPDPVACSSRPNSTTSFLIDASDPFAGWHRSRALEAATEAALELPAGGRFALNVMNPSDPDDVRRLLDLCAPPKAEASDWLRGSVYAERSMRERFLGPIQAGTDAAIASASHTVSPIAETIAAITRDPSFDAKLTNRRLVIVSDMLQNDRLPVRGDRRTRRKDRSGGYTHYASGDVSASFRQSRLARKIRPDLSDASVVIHYLVRPEVAEFQTAAHRRFWRDFLRNAGARQVEFRGIPADQVAGGHL